MLVEFALPELVVHREPMVWAWPVHELLEMFVAGLGRWFGWSVGGGDLIPPVLRAVVTLALVAAFLP